MLGQLLVVIFQVRKDTLEDYWIFDALEGSIDEIVKNVD
jgi:hypothetical protein